MDSDNLKQSTESNKNEEQVAEQNRHKLDEAIKESNEVLIKCSTSLTAFPDTLTVDRAKLTIVKRNFLSSAELVSMRIEDILNVTASVGPFFGVVDISSRVVNANQLSVGKFSRDDALKIKRVAQGYAIALQREIDCNSLSSRELVSRLYELGEDDHDEESLI